MESALRDGETYPETYLKREIWLPQFDLAGHLVGTPAFAFAV
jgi:hypothetical protein